MGDCAWNLFKDFYDFLLRVENLDIDTLKIFEIIFTFIKTTLCKTSKDKTTQFSCQEDSKKIEACRSNLSKIIRLLKETDEKRDNFTRTFFNWKIHRTEVINQLGEIAGVLHKEKKIINYGKIAGAAVGIAGGAAIVGSIFFPPAAIATVPWLGGLGGSAVASFLPSFLVTYTPAVSALAVGGGAATAASSALTIGFTAAEILLLKKHMKDASKVIKKEEEYFHLMEEWFTHTQQVIDLMKEIFEFHILKEIFKDFLDFLKREEDLKESPAYKIYEALEVLLKIVLKKTEQSLILLELKIAIFGILLVFFLIHRRNTILLSFIISLEGLISLTYVVDATFMGASATATLIKEGTKVSSKQAPRLLVRNITVGAFAGVGIALNAANVVLTSFDVYEGSKSEYGKKIEEIQSKLTEELELFEQVNTELNTES